MGEARKKQLFQEEVERRISGWKEVNRVKDLKIFFAGNATLVGEYQEEEGKRKLIKPRAINLVVDPHGRQTIVMGVLVGLPNEIALLAPVIGYDVEDEQIINLYIQATTNIVPAKEIPDINKMFPPGGKA